MTIKKEQPSSEEIQKQLTSISNTIDSIKISQRSQHTCIKVVMRKILKCLEILFHKEVK